MLGEMKANCRSASLPTILYVATNTWQSAHAVCALIRLNAGLMTYSLLLS
jgi:hypothetical protein